jgi:hypothetical protein
MDAAAPTATPSDYGPKRKDHTVKREFVSPKVRGKRAGNVYKTPLNVAIRGRFAEIRPRQRLQ